MDLKEGRKKARKTQEALAEIAGIGQPDVSRLENGETLMGLKSAEKLAEHVKPSATELMIENRVAAMKRAISLGDVEGVLKAAHSVVKLSEGHSLTPEGEAYLDGVVDLALKFAEGGFDFEEEEEEDLDGFDEDADLENDDDFEDDEDLYDNEGRAWDGRRVAKMSGPVYTDAMGDGRDWLGRRIQPLEEVMGVPTDEYGDTRDAYGRQLDPAKKGGNRG